MTRCSLVTSAAVMLALASGCKSNNNSTPPPVTDGGTDAGTPDAGPGDGGTPTTLTDVTNNPAEDVFALPLDAAPSPDASKIYFIAVGSNGGSVFSTSAAAGSTASLISGGGAMVAPLGLAVSTDGTNLYVADPGATTASGNDKGALLLVPAAGGTPAIVAETVDFAPRAVAVSQVGGSDEIVFIGTSTTANADGSFSDGVFKDVSGTVTAISTSGNPAAVAVGTNGTIYVLDQAGTIASFAAGATTGTALPGASQSLNVSFPSGMDLSLDQTALLVTGFDTTGAEAVNRVNIATGAVTALSLTPAITPAAHGGEPSGLHRALNSDSFAFVDGSANTSGTIYLLK
jgi:DNA-binding beta-propeller fold protein YncE